VDNHNMREKQIQLLRDKYKNHWRYSHVEKIMAAIEHNCINKTPKSVMCGLRHFFQEDRVFLNELTARLKTLKVNV